MLDLSTKRIVLLATALALVAEAVLAGRGWPALLTLAVVFACAAMAATSLDRRAVSVVLFCTYLTPAAIFVSHEEFHPFYTVMWLAALFGAMVPDGVRTTWRIPGRWRLPLVFWALVTIVSSVVVTGRELDFNRALLAAEFQPGSALGGLPPFTVTWVLHVTTTQLLGILWFDWLFGQGQRILRLVVSSLAASAAILMFVAAYQAFGEVEFLNPTAFGATGRASGTLLDANLAGAIGAMWIGIAVAAPSLWTEPPRWLRSLCSRSRLWLAHRARHRFADGAAWGRHHFGVRAHGLREERRAGGSGRTGSNLGGARLDAESRDSLARGDTSASSRSGHRLSAARAGRARRRTDRTVVALAARHLARGLDRVRTRIVEPQWLRHGVHGHDSRVSLVWHWHRLVPDAVAALCARPRARQRAELVSPHRDRAGRGRRTGTARVDGALCSGGLRAGSPTVRVGVGVARRADVGRCGRARRRAGAGSDSRAHALDGCVLVLHAPRRGHRRGSCEERE